MNNFYEHVMVWCSDSLVDTLTIQPSMNNPAHEFRRKENLLLLDTWSGLTTCVDCAKDHSGGKCIYVTVVVFITTSFLVMVIAPVVLVVENSVHLYGSG